MGVTSSILWQAAELPPPSVDIRQLQRRSLAINAYVKGETQQQDENTTIMDSPTPSRQSDGGKNNDVWRKFKERLAAKKRVRENPPNDNVPSTSRAIMPWMPSVRDSISESEPIKTEKEAESEPQTEAVMKPEEPSDEESGAPLMDQKDSGTPLTASAPLDLEDSSLSLTASASLDGEVNGTPLTVSVSMDDEAATGPPVICIVSASEESLSEKAPEHVSEGATGPPVIHIISSSEESLSEKAPKRQIFGNKTAAYKLLADRLKLRAASLAEPDINQIITELHNLGYNFPNHIDVATRPVSQWTRHQMVVELRQEKKRQQFMQKSLCDMGQCSCHREQKVFRFSPDVKRCMTGEDGWTNIDQLVVHLGNIGYFLPMHIDLSRPISQLARQQISFELRQEARRQRHIELSICEAGYATEEDDIMLSEENEEDEYEDVDSQDIQALVVNLRNAGYQFPEYLDLQEPVSQLTRMQMRFELRKEQERLRSIERRICEDELAFQDHDGEEISDSRSTTSSEEATDSSTSYVTDLTNMLSGWGSSLLSTLSAWAW